MRIGVDLSLLAQGPGVVRRGVGRYALQQLGAVAQRCSDHAVIGLVPAEVDVNRASPELVSTPGLTLARFPRRPATRREALQSAIREFALDVVHDTSPLFHPFEPNLEAAVVATLYDAIPLAYPLAYLAAEGDATPVYLGSANRLRRADHVLAISEAARRDAVAYFGVDSAATSVAYPFADPGFGPLGAPERARRLARLRRQHRLPERYIVAVPHLHHSKNIAGLLDAMALLPAHELAERPLVIACALDPREAGTLSRMIASRALTDHVRVTGYISDGELAALYGGADLALHLSHLEGFGLPALEAMQCGTPVLVSRDTATAEIVGRLDLTVDAEDPFAVAARVRALLAATPAERERLGRQCLERAGDFGAARLARDTLAAYSAAHERRSHTAVDPFQPRRWTTVDAIHAAQRSTNPADRVIRVQIEGLETQPIPTGGVPLHAMEHPAQGARIEGLAHPLLTRTDVIDVLHAAQAAVAPGGWIQGEILLCESCPADVSLIDLDLPAFFRDEWEAWLGERLQIERSDDLGPVTGVLGALPSALDVATLTRGVLDSVLPDQRTVYLAGVAAGLYAFRIDLHSPLPDWPLAFEARQRQRSLQARRHWLERLQAEQAYLVEVSLRGLTPPGAERLPAWLRKPLRHIRRLAQLGRAQEAQVVVTQTLIQGVARASRRPTIRAIDCLVASPLDGNDDRSGA